MKKQILKDHSDEERGGDQRDHEKERTGREKGHTPDWGWLDCFTGALGMSHVIHGAPDLRVGNQKTSDASKTGVIVLRCMMSSLKQKRRGVCWLERGCAGVPTVRLPRLPLRIV